MWSNSLPGQAITISTPLDRTSFWGFLFTPPYIVVLFRPVFIPSCCIDWFIWSASSLVGAIIKDLGCCFFCPTWLDKSFSRMGRANAAVFPVPVCASPNMSFPSSASGIDFSWIGVVSAYPVFWIPYRIVFDRFSCSNFRTCPPKITMD